MPVRFFRAAGLPAARRRRWSCSLLVLVIGNEVNGARSWIALPMGFNLQPAELAKLALALWGADLLVRKQRLLRRAAPPARAAACRSPVVVLGLILLQPDFGTAVSVCVGRRRRCCGWSARRCGCSPALCGVVAVAAGLLAVSAPHRVERLLSFLDPFADAGDTGYQAVQGFYALSSGGWFGLGLGASREKWAGGLPEAHTDYIFAIVGEELGLLGTLTVLVLFTVLIYSGVRIAHRADRPVRAAGVLRRHRLARRPGDHQHGRGRRAAADHRHPAAAGLLRRLVAARDARRDRHAARLRPPGARRRRGAALAHRRARAGCACARAVRRAAPAHRRRPARCPAPPARTACPRPSGGRSGQAPRRPAGRR